MTARPRWIPRVCVWEVTLACNARCVHCGSDAGAARSAELNTVEALHVIEQLAALGCRSVTLSGGEPLLRSDWPDLVAAIRAAGMRAELITNGLAVAARAADLARAGLWGVTFSVDGPAEVHDDLRGVRHALERLLRGADALRERGVRTGAATQVNRRNLDRLEETWALLRSRGFLGWQVQLTMAHGRAARPESSVVLEQDQLPELERSLLELKARDPDFLHVADNIGYLSRNEPRLRDGEGPMRFWRGCQAGLEVIGLTSDGVVRGCLSLPPALDEGSVRDLSLGEIWNDPEKFHYNRSFSAADLTGPCRACPLGQICRAGCTSLALATTGTVTACARCLRQTEEQDPRG